MLQTLLYRLLCGKIRRLTLLQTLTTHFTVQAPVCAKSTSTLNKRDIHVRIGEPLDTYSLTNIHGAVDCTLSNCDNLTNALVSADKRQLGFGRPVSRGCMEVCMTHTRAVELNETFVRSEGVQFRNGVGWLNGDGGAQ